MRLETDGRAFKRQVAPRKVSRLHLEVALDKSGSMNASRNNEGHNKMDSVIFAATVLVELAEKLKCNIGVTAYDGIVYDVVDRKRITSTKRILWSIKAGGGTRQDHALEALERSFKDGDKDLKRIAIVLCDGDCSDVKAQHIDALKRLRVKPYAVTIGVSSSEMARYNALYENRAHHLIQKSGLEEELVDVFTRLFRNAYLAS